MLGSNVFHGQLDTIKKINNKEAGGGHGFISFKNGKNAETGPNDFEK